MSRSLSEEFSRSQSDRSYPEDQPQSASTTPPSSNSTMNVLPPMNHKAPSAKNPPYPPQYHGPPARTTTLTLPPPTGLYSPSMRSPVGNGLAAYSASHRGQYHSAPSTQLPPIWGSEGHRHGPMPGHPPANMADVRFKRPLADESSEASLPFKRKRHSVSYTSQYNPPSSIHPVPHSVPAHAPAPVPAPAPIASSAHLVPDASGRLPRHTLPVENPHATPAVPLSPVNLYLASVDSVSASAASNEARLRNAGASSRFRARQKIQRAHDNFYLKDYKVELDERTTAASNYAAAAMHYKSQVSEIERAFRGGEDLEAIFASFGPEPECMAQPEEVQRAIDGQFPEPKGREERRAELNKELDGIQSGKGQRKNQGQTNRSRRNGKSPPPNAAHSSGSVSSATQSPEPNNLGYVFQNDEVRPPPPPSYQNGYASNQEQRNDLLATSPRASHVAPGYSAPSDRGRPVYNSWPGPRTAPEYPPSDYRGSSSHGYHGSAHR